MTAIGKSQLPKAAVLLFTNALGAALSVCFANFSKHIINGATEYKDWGYVVRYAVYLLILIMVQMALNLIGSSFSERCKARLDMIFKKHMLQVLIKKDYASVSKYHTGELNNLLFNDVQVITDGYTTLLPNVVFFIVKLLSALYTVLALRRFAKLHPETQSMLEDLTGEDLNGDGVVAPDVTRTDAEATAVELDHVDESATVDQEDRE